MVDFGIDNPPNLKSKLRASLTDLTVRKTIETPEGEGALYGRREVAIAGDLVRELYRWSRGDVTENAIADVSRVTGIEEDILSNAWDIEVVEHAEAPNPLVTRDVPGKLSPNERTFKRHLLYIEQNIGKQTDRDIANEMDHLGFGNQTRALLRARKLMNEAKVVFGSAKFTSGALSK